FIFRLPPRRIDDVPPFVLDLVQPRLKFGLLFLQILQHRVDGDALFADVLAGALDFVEQIIGDEVLSRYHAPCRCDNFRVQAQPLGNRQRVRASRQADDQAVSRAQRFEVKLDTGIAYAGSLYSVDFEFRVMGRHDGCDAAVLQMIEQRPRQRRTFRRVGSRADFIQQHQRTLVGFAQDADGIGHVRRKGAEILLDALLVTDVGVDALEYAQFGVLHRQMQTALRHHRQQTNRLERDCLAAGVRPGDDQHPRIRVKLYINRHDIAGQQRVTRPDQPDGAAGFVAFRAQRHEYRLNRLEVFGIARFGKHQINVPQHLYCPHNVFRFLADALGQRRQNPP